MSREILLLVDALAREKNVNKDVVFVALEMALASATKKRFSDDADVRVAVDRETGDYEAFRRWQVVADDAVENPAQQILLSEALKQHAELEERRARLEDELRYNQSCFKEAQRQIDAAQSARARGTNAAA
ncbi:MAG: NusA N-terminal domain-containing protein, partial [Pseudomonadota bacterium]